MKFGMFLFKTILRITKDIIKKVNYIFIIVAHVLFKL